MNDWEKLAAELEGIVGESVKDLLESEAPKFKEGLKDLAKDLAKAKVQMHKGNDVERAVAREDFEFLTSSLQSRAAEAGLEMTEVALDTFKRVVQVVARTLLAAAKL
ncbi:hypothetical protein LCGC14_1321300 [marine sediment metagenome]|uniref:Uncharacterized protein n=1 Tax=marine sediment metagenome TaxID=412755 RepID=A0A0F9NLT6_9ZZZZ